MADYGKVSPGDRLRLSAGFVNDAIDTINAAKMGRGGSGNRGGSSTWEATTVLVRNNTETDFDRWGAVALTVPTILPTENEKEFESGPVFDVVAPTDKYKGRFAVLLEPLPAGRIGRACVAGVTTAKVNIRDVNDTRCDVVEEELLLQGSAEGSAQILWVDGWIFGSIGTATATGEQFAVIRIGTPDRPIPIKVVSGTLIEGQNNKWRYSFVEQKLAKNNEWTDLVDGIDSSVDAVYAYNSMEANNSGAGIQGNGVNISNLPAGYTLQPIQGNPVIWAWPITNCDGGVEYYFDVPNAIDGECTPPGGGA